MNNWAGNLEYTAAQIHTPKSVDEICALVAGSEKVRALGTRHSLISTKHLDRILSIDRSHDRATVTIEAGVTYGQLCPVLHREGLALHNLASLPHISVAGACATATHGSGDKNQILASTVSAMDIVNAHGNVQTLSGDLLKGAAVGLGALGIVTRLTLNLQPAFTVRQVVYENLPIAVLRNQFDDIMSSAYSVSLFTDWRSDMINQVWFKRRDGDVPSHFDPASHAMKASRYIHPLIYPSAEHCTEQLGIPGPWHERLPHFRMGFTPSAGEELQAEYLIPRRHAIKAFDAVHEIRDTIAPLLQISEIRSIAADDFWMSPCCGTDCIGIHFTLKKDWPAVKALLPKIEKQLADCEPAPHWGKLFTMAASEIRQRYPRLKDFRTLAERFDPGGKFRNAFLNTHLFAT
jgi:xylitol oxidase